MKKFLITLIVLLFILAIAQGIYYKVRPKEVNIPQEIENQENGEELVEKSMYIYGMLDLYENYNLGLSLEELQSKMYDFVYVNLPEIYKNIEEMDTEETKEYYNENNIKTNMYIYSEENFVMIAKQLQNIYRTKKDISLIESRIDLDNIIRTSEGLIAFDVSLGFDNNRDLRIRVVLSENNKTFQILSDSNLDKIFSNRNLNMKKYEFLDKIENFISNVLRLRALSTLKTENEKMQYFDENKEYLEDLLITDSKDYISITNQINAMNWINGTPIFENYEILDSLSKMEGYDTFKMILYYNNNNKIDLIISIKNEENVIPEIKIAGDESDFQEFYNNN